MENKFRMNLQCFAEPGESQNQQVAAEEGAAGNRADQQTGQLFSQEDVDRIVAQRLARQQRDAESRIARAREEGRTEAERLASMTQEQRIQHEREQNEQAMREREGALAAREAEIARRELRAEAIETLSSRGLPKGLESILNYSSAEVCSQSIAVVEKAFRDAVKAEVDKQLAGSAVELKRGSAQQESKSPGVQMAQQIGKAAADANKAANDILSHYK